jgi:hypothetical protein
MPFFSNPSDVRVTDGVFVDIGRDFNYHAGMLSINCPTVIVLILSSRSQQII